MDQGLLANIESDAHAPLTFDLSAVDDLAVEQEFVPDIVDEASCDTVLCDMPLPFWCIESPAAPSITDIPLPDFHLVAADPDPSGDDPHAPCVGNGPEVASRDAVPAADKAIFCWADCDGVDVADGIVEPATPPRSARCALGACRSSRSRTSLGISVMVLGRIARWSPASGARTPRSMVSHLGPLRMTCRQLLILLRPNLAS